MKRLLRFLKYAGFAMVMLALAGVVWLVWLANTRLPMQDGVVTSSQLQGTAELIRDDWGVPHITAEGEADAYFALGYAMAQDRLFQMEALRRLARGELAEILGPPLVPIDKIMRAFRLRAMAEDYFTRDPEEHAEVRAVAEAFTAGINHFMETEPLPFEFAVLRMPPRPFGPEDCLTVAAILPITFADGLRGDVLGALVEEALPEVDMRLLFPGYSREIPATVMERLDEAAGYLAGTWPPEPEPEPALDEDAAEEAIAEEETGEEETGEEETGEDGGEEAAPPENEAAAQGSLDEALDSLRAYLGALFEFTAPHGHAWGSNSWVIAPERSASGGALLANDPHIGFTNPSIWYEAHLRFGAFQNYGYHLPLIPFPLLGHNTDRGWALTMFANDDVDIYRETFKEDDPGQVMYRGEWHPVRVEREHIRVRFGRDVDYEVRVTPHGPVITDLFAALGGYTGPPVSLRWVWQQVEYTDMVAFYRFGHARNYEDFAAAVELITSPGLNVSYADAEGNIAWWAAGRIPIRPAHVNPKSVLDGASGADEILGYVPFEENPHLKNPPWGYIVTANNLSTVFPVGEHGPLQGYWQPGDRAARIEELLDTREQWTLESLRAVQLDDKGWAADAILEACIPILEQGDLTEIEARALTVLRTWDRHHTVDSAGAAIYQWFMDSLLRETLLDELGEDLFSIYGTLADHWNFLKYAIHEDDLPFWNNVNTAERETRADVIRAAFRDTAAGMQRRLGPNPEQWHWGRLHTITFRHPFGYVPVIGNFFNIGPYPVAGGAQQVNNLLYMSGSHDFSVVAGPSTRRLIDFAAPEESYTILPTGNSGNFMSPHYADQTEMFVRGEYRRAHFTEDQIQAHARSRISFRPPA